MRNLTSGGRNVKEKSTLGRSSGLNPVSILPALIFFGMIWGLVGAFRATTVTAVVKIILEGIPATRFAATLPAGTCGDSPEQPEPATP